MRRRHLIGWIVGILVIVIGRGLSLYFERTPLEFNLWQFTQPGRLESIFRELARPGRLPFDLLLLWSLLVLLWWIWDQVRLSRELGSKSRQFYFLLVWVVGGIIVVNWGLWFLSNITPLEISGADQIGSLAPAFEDSSSFGDIGSSTTGLPGGAAEYSSIIALVAAWSAIIIVVLLLIGDDGVKGGFYETSIAPYRAVLLTLTVVILVTLLANVFAFVGIQSRVRSLDAPVVLLTATTKTLATTALNLSNYASEFEQKVDSKIWEQEEDGESRREVLDSLANQGTQMVQLATDTSNLAYSTVSQLKSAIAIEAIELENAGLEPSDAELPAIQNVLNEAQSSAYRLSGRANSMRYKFLPYLRGEDPFIPVLLLSDVRDIVNEARTTNLRATAASEALIGLESRGTSIFLWLGAFYSSFVLFPWILLLMFFYRKREFRAFEIIEDLTRLDPSKTLLQRALGGKLTTKQLAQLSSRAAEQHLQNRAFGNREYVLSSVLLTILTAAGWYYFLYPRADIGISDLVRSGAGITQLTKDLATHASPLTMGFAGAYFFVAQMLLRRYLAGDLYPSAYLQGAVRIIWVFTLSVALAVLLPEGQEWMKFGAIIAFMAGIFPREGLRIISAAASGFAARLLTPVLPDKAFPADTDVMPLTELDGINIWVESRLLEENVENVQGMATASMEHLVVGTYYPASRIVDWVDQAILLTHCGDEQEWCSQLRAVGVRTATDLLDAASPAHSSTSCPDDLAFDPEGDELVTLAKAVVEANPTSAPGTPTLTATVLSEMCKVMWPDPNLRYVQRYRTSMNFVAKADDGSPADIRMTVPNGKNGAMKDEMVLEVTEGLDTSPRPNDELPHA